jgi:solute carrier family 25 oxoglutarate transporter 11
VYAAAFEQKGFGDLKVVMAVDNEQFCELVTAVQMEPEAVAVLRRAIFGSRTPGPVRSAATAKPPPAAARQATASSVTATGGEKGTAGEPTGALFNFVSGGFAGCCATLLVQPMDVIKIRLLMDGAGGTAKKYSGFLDAVRQTVAENGVGGLWAGSAAGMLRQATYGASKLGLYQLLLEWCTPTDGSALSYVFKLALGLLSGSVASVVGSPADVCLSRMSADAALPPALRRKYPIAIACMATVVRTEGVGALFGGLGASILRAMLVSAGQLGTYTQAKEFLAGRVPDGGAMHACASMVAAVAASVFSMPADSIKTRMQLGGSQYSGFLDCVRQTVGRDGAAGVLRLWDGVGALYLKIAPHTVVSFLILENLQKWVKRRAALRAAAAAAAAGSAGGGAPTPVARRLETVSSGK